jgi:glutathione S-transferase
MRPWLALTHASVKFETETVELPHMHRPTEQTSLAERRAKGSVRGLFPVLRVDGTLIHESLAICEYVADTHPQAKLWPADALQRAQARAICTEMVSGFTGMRGELSSHLFGRVAGFKPGAAAQTDIARVLEIWDEKLSRSGGPFLFGDSRSRTRCIPCSGASARTGSTPLRSPVRPGPRSASGGTGADRGRAHGADPVYDDALRRGPSPTPCRN